MVCLDLLLRKQWIERERLSYPIVKLSLEMVRPRLAFAIQDGVARLCHRAGGIDFINGMHVFFRPSRRFQSAM